METVSEISQITGISVRTIQYYDKIGLLPPDELTKSGYRLYGENSLKRLRNILLFKELEFSLKEIKMILDNPDFDEKCALENQINLLKLKRKRLDEIIMLACELKEKGDDILIFQYLIKKK